MITFSSPRQEYKALHADIDSAITRVLDKGNFVLGCEVERFEQLFSSYVSADFCVGVGNGLDALTLSLMALDIGAGDQVIVPSHTFFATWLAVVRIGATPVCVDVDASTFLIRADRIQEKITRSTKAIIPVHLYGNVADIDMISRIAADCGIDVVEDAAQAHGSVYKGRRVGSHSRLVAWSFYPTKNLGCLGDGGAVTTSDPVLAHKLRLLRNYGSVEKYRHELLGLNSRLDELQAAVLSVKLQSLDNWNARRRFIAHFYNKNIKNSLVQLPDVLSNQVQSWHLYVVRCRSRDGLMGHLRDRGIPTLIHYAVPPSMQPALRFSSVFGSPSPVANDLAATVLSLPMHPFLTDGEIDHIVSSVNSFK